MYNWTKLLNKYLITTEAESCLCAVQSEIRTGAQMKPEAEARANEAELEAEKWIYE